jgi:hypothetical protein
MVISCSLISSTLTVTQVEPLLSKLVSDKIFRLADQPLFSTNTSSSKSSPASGSLSSALQRLQLSLVVSLHEHAADSDSAAAAIAASVSADLSHSGVGSARVHAHVARRTLRVDVSSSEARRAIRVLTKRPEVHWVERQQRMRTMNRFD